MLVTRPQAQHSPSNRESLDWCNCLACTLRHPIVMFCVSRTQNSHSLAALWQQQQSCSQQILQSSYVPGAPTLINMQGIRTVSCEVYYTHDTVGR